MSDFEVRPCLDGRAFLLRVWGNRTPEDAFGTLAYFTRAYLAQPVRNILFDPRKAQYMRNMNMYMFRGMSKVAELPPSRIAVLNAKPVAHLTSIALEIINMSTSHKMRVFNCEKKAEAWLLDHSSTLQAETKKADPLPSPPPSSSEDDVFFID